MSLAGRPRSPDMTGLGDPAWLSSHQRTPPGNVTAADRDFPAPSVEAAERSRQWSSHSGRRRWKPRFSPPGPTSAPGATLLAPGGG